MFLVKFELMKMYVLLIAVVVLALILTAFKAGSKKVEYTTTVQGGFYDLNYTSIEGEEVSMQNFKGKYVLCVNVASKCGYTPQYKDLQALYEQYNDKLVIIGFPCNQFMNQEPGTEEQIATFCEKNYGVSFPLSEKIQVKGKGQHPIYQWLTNADLNGVDDGKVKWNFHKFLISPEGKWLGSFGSSTKPMDEKITSLIN